MELDRATIGDAPAALYLVDTLNKIGDPRIARKLTKFISNVRTLLGQVYAAHNVSALSAHYVGFIVNASRRELDEAWQLLRYQYLGATEDEELALSLAENVWRGELKRAARIVAKVRHSEQKFERYAGRKRAKGEWVEPVKVYLDPETDSINAESLRSASRAKLESRGKECKLY